MSDRDESKRDPERSQAKAPPLRAGHVVPADRALVEWLEKLWTRQNPPDRLEVWWMLGANKDVRRGLVFYKNFALDQVLDIEQCTRLAGELLTEAQNWADAKRRLCWFDIAITDYHQQTVPLTRPLGPLRPQQAYSGVGPDGDSVGEDEGEEDGGLKPLSHKYLRNMFRATYKAMVQTHAMMGDFMQLQQGAMLSMGSHNERLQNANMALHESKQTAEDRAAERAVWVRKEEAKVRAIEGGVKVGTNLVYGWLGMPSESSGEAPGAGSHTPSAKLCPESAERQLVESFLHEAAEEKLSIRLFGDWKDTDRLTVHDVLAGLGLEKPGIFTAQQFGILLAVHERLLPPDALDPLLNDSGKPQAITAEQMLLAQPLLTQGMAVALMQIRQLRLAAREKRTALGGQPAAAEHNGAPK